MSATDHWADGSAKYVEQLRKAADVTDNADYREWFESNAYRLEAGLSVICPDEVILTAEIEMQRAAKREGQS